MVMMVLVLWSETRHWRAKVAMALGLKMLQKCGRNQRKVGGDDRVYADDLDPTTWQNWDVQQLVGLMGFI